MNALGKRDTRWHSPVDGFIPAARADGEKEGAFCALAGQGVQRSFGVVRTRASMASRCAVRHEIILGMRRCGVQLYEGALRRGEKALLSAAPFSSGICEAIG